MKVLLSLVAIIFIAVPSLSHAETLAWGITSFPPGYITQGPDKGQGYADLLEKFMRGKLTQYDHDIIEYPNWERQLAAMQNGPLVCTSILWYRPPGARQSIKGAYRVSAPNGVFFLHDVVVHKDMRDQYGDEVSFKDLLSNPDLTFGYNRPYGPMFNRILADHLGIPPGVELDAMNAMDRINHLRNAKNVQIRSGSDPIGGLLKMLWRKRVDYVLEYEFMIRYERKKQGFGDELVSIPVIEGRDQINRIAFACSDTPEGEKAIAAINVVLKKYRHTDEFKRALEWLVPKDREDLYWREYDKILTIME